VVGNLVRRIKFWHILVLYLLLRLCNLTLLPVFNDEAIYIDWGQTMVGSGHLFLSLFDGKQPFLMWIFGLFANVFSDPLFSGRLVSVAAGALTVFGIYKIGTELFDRKVAVLSTFLYIFAPLYLFFDRQALMESTVSAVGVWSFFLLARVINYKKKNDFYLVYFAAEGILAGVGFFIKSSALIFPILFILGLILFQFKKVKCYFPGFVVLLILAFVTTLPLFLQADFNKVIELNSRFSFSVGELFSFPFKSWLTNLLSVVGIVFFQTLSLLVIGLLFSFKFFKEKGLKLVLFWLTGSVLFYIIFSKNANSRYLVSFLPLVIIPAVYGMSKIKKEIAVLISVLAFMYFLFFDAKLIFDPIGYFSNLSKISKYSQKEVYLGTFTSGYGVKDAISYVLGKVENAKTLVLVRDDSGNPENAVFMYFSKYKNAKVVYVNSGTTALLKEIHDEKLLLSTYFISREDNLSGLGNMFNLEKKFLKPDGISWVGVYKLKNNIGR
jgi:4-amino-4-deoxy-L-arabinose transferase-like glycosyltransferase